MRLACPHCGQRDLREYSVKGAARFDRPDGVEWSEEWNDYIHLRDNPAGVSREFWHHEPCGSWLVVERNTLTHEVHKVWLAPEALR